MGNLALAWYLDLIDKNIAKPRDVASFFQERQELRYRFL